MAHEELTFTSRWTCVNGHVTEVWTARINDGAFIRGSTWDSCDRCSEGPTQVDLKRMWGEVYTQAEEKGVVFNRATGSLAQVRIEVEVRLIIDAIDDVSVVDSIAAALEEKRAELVEGDEGLRRRAEHLRTNRRVLLKAGLIGRCDVDDREVIQSVNNSVIKVYDLLDECDFDVEAASLRKGQDFPNGVAVLLEDARRRLAGLSEDGISDEYGIYAHGARRSLADMREFHERLSRTLKRLQSKGRE